MINDDPTKDATHAAEIELMRQELSNHQELIAALKKQLAHYEQSDTVPPDAGSSAEHDTGDYTQDKQEARIQMLEAAIATRDRELLEVNRQLLDIKQILTDVAMTVARLPCATCHERQLILVPPSGKPGA